MKRFVIAIVVLMAVVPARAQFFKKLKDEASQKLKEKLDQKKAQKIDESTEKASSTIMSVPDSVVKKTGRALKSRKKEGHGGDSTGVRALTDTVGMRPNEELKPVKDSTTVKSGGR